MTIELTNEEIYLLLNVLEAHSANIKIKAAKGEYNKEVADSKCKRMCELSSKIYQKKIREKRNA